jgi:3-oxoacyl-[acyl-carrier protein] reductase
VSLNGEIAIVTGATRGIGRAVAERLAADGARVVGTATSPQGAETISGYLGDKGFGRVLDVRDMKSCEALVEDVTKTLGGPVAILVNNAGVTRDMLMLRLKEEDWLEVIDTDLNSAFRMTRAVLRGMLKSPHGRIISIGSVVGMMGNVGQANYAAAKAGLIGFTKTLARELGKREITANVIAPGFIDTDMTRHLPPEITADLMNRVFIKRLGLPEDIAAAVSYLASKSAGYVTGETLHVNGGMYMG